MLKKIQERINLFIAKSPKKAVLVGIMLFNITFIMIAAGIIAVLSQHLSGLKACGFWESVYYTITMILDAGCIDNVITDVGQAGAFAAIICIIVIVLGMIFFSGAVIGYVTNIISDFIDSKNNGKIKLHLSNHIVIINWNSRASEILNEYLYANKSVKIVVFVPDHREEIDEEIRNRLNTTLMQEIEAVLETTAQMSFFKKRRYLRENLPKGKMIHIVREGDVAAPTDLDDICISKAGSVIILDNESRFNRGLGNTQTIKTLIQVSEISKGNRNQTILVEVDDEWTENLVRKIIAFRGKDGQELIIPIYYKRLLGKTNAQIAAMPELNPVYHTLLSNKGPHFISQQVPAEYTRENENAFIEKALIENPYAVPLTIMETAKGNRAFFMITSGSDLESKKESFRGKTWARLKPKPVYSRKNIMVLGHNSNMVALMDGFDRIRKKRYHENGDDGLYLMMLDEEESLKNHNHYRNYPFVHTLAADIYDDDTIDQKFCEFADKNEEDTTILILSDDRVENEDVDADVLTYLIYIQEQISQREKNDPDFRRASLNVVVEIQNPKNEEIVKNYGADQVIISSRYVSRIISQISLGEATFEFYENILSCDACFDICDGRRISIISAENFFEEIPEKCTAGELIRMVFAGGEKDSKSMILGYIRHKKDYIFFSGDRRKIEVALEPGDQLIIFGK